MNRCMTRRNFLQATTAAALASVAMTPKRGLRAKVVPAGGALKIEINGTVFEPLAFRSFRPEERNIHEFYDAGLRLMSVLHTGMNCTLDVPYSKFGEVWTGPRQYDFAAFDRQMELFLRHAPEAYFNIMLQLDTRDWYLRAHPECSNSYWNLVEMAGHAPWREDTAAALQDMLRYVEGKYGDRVFAYSLFCGSSTEWYTNSHSYRGPEAQIREHPVKEACFRKFTGDPQAKLMPLAELHRTSHGAFRDPVQDAAALRYWRFHHEIIGDTILYFARRTQEVLQHRKLLGLFYGYLNTLGGRRLLEEGHLGYERVWRCPDLDMIFAPAKGGQPRSFEGASGYLQTVDSLGLHNKLTFQEIDHTTYIAPLTVENGRRIPGSSSKLKDEFQTRMVLRREFALTRVKRTAFWWFDFFGGYYYAPPLMKEVANMVRVQERLKDVPMRSAAEIAVFGDVASMYHASALVPLSDDLLVRPPDELARIGAPYDIYTFSDLDHKRLPLAQYKLVVFLNAFLIPRDKREFIRAKLQAGGRTLLWIYAPNYIQPRGFSTDGISEITGITVTGREGDESAVQVGDTRFGFSKKLSPLFEVRDKDAQVLGTYVSNGAPALAVKKLARHTSVYSAVGNLPAAVYREIARAAGVHIYYEGRDPVYINNRLLGIHMQSDAAPMINLPSRKPMRLEELFDGGEVRVENGICRLPHQPGATKLYLLP
ncbi:MAG: hypothetical protein WCV00_05340 [Verrucomicrobiia bacterium]|jgi:hypothetical protein